MGAELLLSVTGDSTVDNTSAETSIFSDTVPAGTPGADELLICRYIGDIRNDSGAARTATLRWKYGGTTFFTFTTINLNDAGATNRYADIGTMFLGGENATNAQRAMFEHRQSGAISTPPGLYAGGNDHNTGVKSGTVDSTSAQTLELTCQLSAADTELEYRRRGVWVERWTTDDPASGTAGTRLVPGTLDTSEVTVVNTTTATSVYSVTIPGGTIGTGNLLILRMHMDFLNNSGSDKQWWTDVFFGGTQLFDGVTGTNNASAATRRGAPIEVWIGGAGTTGTQVAAMVGQTISTAVTGGEGVGLGGSNSSNNSISSCSIDSTVDQTLEVFVDMSAADPATEVRKLVGSVSVVKA